MTREYSHEFVCSYELRYYPFDTQLCSVQLEVVGNMEDKIVLRVNDLASGVHVLGKDKVVGSLSKIE